jgi:anti-anti-sigma regulatory factor
MAELAVHSVALPGVFDLDALDAVRDRLGDAVETKTVEVRADAVERVATNALLMLLSAARTAETSGHRLSIAAASPQLRAAIDRLGLEGAFAGLLQD